MSDTSAVPANRQEGQQGHSFASVDRNSLADLVLVVTKSTVEGSKLSELTALVIVLSLGDGSSLRK